MKRRGPAKPELRHVAEHVVPLWHDASLHPGHQVAERLLSRDAVEAAVPGPADRPLYQQVSGARGLGATIEEVRHGLLDFRPSAERSPGRLNLFRLGGRIVKVPHERWWQALEESAYPELGGLFVHPVQDEAVMAGNGTIGLELLEDLPEPDVVLVPFGGGGLSSGIASAVKALRPETKVYAVELLPARSICARWKISRAGWSISARAARGSRPRPPISPAPRHPPVKSPPCRKAANRSAPCWPSSS